MTQLGPDGKIVTEKELPKGFMTAKKTILNLKYDLPVQNVALHIKLLKGIAVYRV